MKNALSYSLHVFQPPPPLHPSSNVSWKWPFYDMLEELLKSFIEKMKFRGYSSLKWKSSAPISNEVDVFE